MAKKTNGKVHSVYLVNKQKLLDEFVAEDKELMSESVSEIDIIQKSIDSLMENVNTSEGNIYLSQSFKESANFGNFSALLYYADISKPNSSIREFFNTFVKADENILKAKTFRASYILFLYNETNIFCITGGNGQFVISKYSMPKFGLVIMSNYISKFKISAYRDNEVDSAIHASETIYRGQTMFQSIDAWSKVFKELTGKIDDKEIIKQLINPDEKKDVKAVIINAKDSFKIGNKLDINKLILLLNEFDEILKEGGSDSFNIYLPLTKKNDEKQINANNIIVSNLLYDLYNKYKNDEEYSSEFDIFHEDEHLFVSCTSANIYYKKEIFDENQTIENILDIIFLGFNSLVANEKMENTANDFANFILESKLRCYAESEFPATDGKIINHVSGEIIAEGKKYYIFNGEYFLIEEKYIDYLNKGLRARLTEDIFIDKLKTEWQDDEHKFNAKCRDDESLIHLHRLKPDNIEFCDLLEFTDDNDAYIYHVKDGFNGTMRDLVRQVELSLECLRSLTNNNSVEYFERLYDNAVGNDYCSPNLKDLIIKEEFIERLRTYKPTFVIVLHEERDLRDIEGFDSNIAKHCLYDLTNHMYSNNKELKIQLIR